MELCHLSLQNFRQFRDAELGFSCADANNVTIIYGDNGVGKTTLLNAFTWLLFEDVAFEMYPERLANHDAMAAADPGGHVTVAVTLLFSHDGAEYEVTRTATYQKEIQSDVEGTLRDQSLTVTVDDDGSENNRRNAPQNALNQIIPNPLSEFFFVQGEAITKSDRPTDQRHLQAAVSKIMGLTVVERAALHLDEVARDFETTVHERTTGQLNELLIEKQEIESTLDELKQKRERKQQAIGHLEMEVEDIESSMDRHEEYRRLKTELEQYREEKQTLEESDKRLTNDIREKVAESGLLSLAKPMLQEVAAEIEQRRDDGVFLSALADKPFDSQLDALRTVGHLYEGTGCQIDFVEEADMLRARRQEKREEIRRKEELIDEISSEIHTLNGETTQSETLSELISRREDKTAELETLRTESTRLDDKIERTAARLDDLVQEIADVDDEWQPVGITKRRQMAAKMVQQEFANNFDKLQTKT